MLFAIDMFVNVVFSIEKALSFVHGGVQFNPSLGVGHMEPLGRKAVLQKPVLDGLDGLRARCKGFSDLCRSPVVPIVWRIRMGDIINEFIYGWDIGLGKTKTKRKDCCSGEFAGIRPVSGDVITLLVENQRRENGSSECQANKSK